MKVIELGLLAGLAGLAACSGGAVQTSTTKGAITVDNDPEANAAATMESLRTDPTGLAAFLAKVPKGGDLHNHLSGAVYAESYLAWGSAAGMCLDGSFRALPAESCGKNVQMPSLATDPLYAQTIAAWSMQGFTPSATESGHDHFFATFDKFGAAAAGRSGDMLAEVVERAGEQNEQYIELMMSLTAGDAEEIAARVWGSSRPPPAAQDFEPLREELVADSAWNAVMTGATSMLDASEARMKTLLGCGGAAPKPGCSVTVRYLFQTTRTSPPHELFAEFVAAFEVAKREPRIVGMNLVSPEDNAVSLADYDLQMSMLDALHATYATSADTSPLHIALHAGELSAAVLPAGDTVNLTFHIRRALEVGHAERIGHGVDLATETMSTELLGELAAAGALVETCLTSNADILEVSGAAHPLSAYLAANVPVALATDDEGVSRSNITNEFVRAALDQKLDYLQLKAMTRASVAHGFLAPADKAHVQAELEAAWTAFEASLPTAN